MDTGGYSRAYWRGAIHAHQRQQTAQYGRFQAYRGEDQTSESLEYDHHHQYTREQPQRISGESYRPAGRVPAPSQRQKGDIGDIAHYQATHPEEWQYCL